MIIAASILGGFLIALGIVVRYHLHICQRETSCSPHSSLRWQAWNGTYLNGRVEKAKAETEAKVPTASAKATVMKKVAAGEMDWNQTWAEGAQSSWKDEWLTILVSIPRLILAFTGYEDVVARGFDALNAMPDYYETAVGVVFAAIASASSQSPRCSRSDDGMVGTMARHNGHNQFGIVNLGRWIADRKRK